MHVLDRSTAKYQFGFRPAAMPTPRTLIEVPVVVGALNKFFDGTVDYNGTTVKANKVSPECEALEFYLFNHAMAHVRAQYGELAPMVEHLELVNQYHEAVAVQSRRMFYYLLLICTRESRHEKNSVTGSFWDGMRVKYGEACYEFFKTIRNTGSNSTVESFRAEPPNMSLGDYTNYLCDSFFKGSYSGGYGGKAWGAVAQVLRDFVHGVISAEVMMDTAFTLCHNNGPIFNKGMLFESYSDRIYEILDVQRSGQIPQYLKELAYAGSIPTNLKPAYKLVDRIEEVLGKSFFSPGYVDWHTVEGLGSLKSYPGNKNKQASMVSHAIQAGFTTAPANGVVKNDGTNGATAVKAKNGKSLQKPKTTYKGGVHNVKHSELVGEVISQDDPGDVVSGSVDHESGSVQMNLGAASKVSHLSPVTLLYANQYVTIEELHDE